MKNIRTIRISGCALCLAAALCVGLSPSGADAQAPSPLITAAIPDAETANLTIGGAGFREGFPVVYLGNLELPVRWATESTVDTWLPELQPGTYRLIARWSDGSQADFYLTLGAVGPAGPAGAPGPKGDRGLPGFGGAAHFGAGTAAAPEGFAAADSTSTSTVDRRNVIYRQNGATTPTGLIGGFNTGFGWNVLNNLTSGGNNTSFGTMALNRITTGRRNTAIGAVAMQDARGVSNNTAIGRGALRHILGSDNVAIGVNAGSAYESSGGVLRGTGSRNIYIGNSSGIRNSVGNDNIHIVHGARSNPTGSRNIYIGHTGEPGDSGVVRLGNGNTHTKTYLAGEVIIHGSITGIAGNPLDITGPVNAPTLDTRIETLVAGIKADVDAIDARVKALESADTTTP